jgi:hypothetical protein
MLQEPLEHWYNSPTGQTVLNLERQHLIILLKQLSGTFILQLGGPEGFDLLTEIPIANKIYLRQQPTATLTNFTLQAKYDALPFIENSIDIIIMPHILEFAQQPQDVLREAYQAIIPEGYIIIIGFNPFSLFGMLKPKSGKFITMLRLKHWLHKTGFKPIDYKTLFFKPFLEGLGQMLLPSLGGVYIVMAQKQVITLTKIPKKALKYRTQLAYEKSNNLH